MTFACINGQVVWLTEFGPVNLSNMDCERILNIFWRERAYRLFNELHTAHVQAGGIEWGVAAA